MLCLHGQQALGRIVFKLCNPDPLDALFYKLNNHLVALCTSLVIPWLFYLQGQQSKSLETLYSYTFLISKLKRAEGTSDQSGDFSRHLVEYNDTRRSFLTIKL